MKLLHLLLLSFLASGTLYAADTRIKDLATTSTGAASDDYIVTDGTTNGARKLLGVNALVNNIAYAHGNTGAAVEFNLANGGVQTATLNAATPAITFINWIATSKYSTILLGLTQDTTGGRAPTWPAAVSNTPTISSTANAITWVRLWTLDAGTTIYTASSAQLTSLTADVTGTLPVANGGTGITSGTSGGVLAYTASGTLASSGALAANAIVIGGGAGVAPSTTTTGTGVLTALAVNAGSSGSFLRTADRIVTFVLTIDALANSQNYDIGFVGAAFTVTEIRGVHFGSGLSSPSIVATVKHGTDRSSGTTIEAVTVTSSTTGTSVTSGFDDATVPANSFIWVETASKSGTTDDFTIIVRGTYD